MAEYIITWRPWLLWGVALLVTILGCGPTDAQCPVSGCYGCGARSVSCSAALLNAFPQFPIADQQIIEELVLSANMLTTLTRNDLQNYTALNKLDISANMLTLIEPGTFSVTQHLGILILDDNDLQTIPDNLFINTSLRELQISSNRIENISRALFAGLDPSAKIYLDGNKIQAIPEGALPTNFSQLHLTNNPLACDCGLRWVPDYIDSLDPSVVFDAGTCESPASLHGMELSNLTESQFTCECSPECVNGSCNMALGTCVCDFGFTGDDCSSDACTDGIQNYGETDVDCGGPLCPKCYIGQTCSSDEDCGNATVCLGAYSHPSGLSYPFRIIDDLHCVNEKFPGEELLQKFKDALLGREEALDMTDPLANLTEINRNIKKEIELQFEIEEPLESVIISDLDREPGDPLYQTCIQWSDRVSEDTVESDMQRMVQNMHNGKLKGTLIIRRENKKAVMNI